MFGVDARCVDIDLDIDFAISPREIKTIKRVLYVSLQAQWPLCSDATARVCAPRVFREKTHEPRAPRGSPLFRLRRRTVAALRVPSVLWSIGAVAQLSSRQ